MKAAGDLCEEDSIKENFNPNDELRFPNDKYKNWKKNMKSQSTDNIPQMIVNEMKLDKNQIIKPNVNTNNFILSKIEDCDKESFNKFIKYFEILCNRDNLIETELSEDESTCQIVSFVVLIYLIGLFTLGQFIRVGVLMIISVCLLLATITIFIFFQLSIGCEKREELEKKQGYDTLNNAKYVGLVELNEEFDYFKIQYQDSGYYQVLNMESARNFDNNGVGWDTIMFIHQIQEDLHKDDVEQVGGLKYTNNY